MCVSSLLLHLVIGTKASRRARGGFPQDLSSFRHAACYSVSPKCHSATGMRPGGMSKVPVRAGIGNLAWYLVSPDDHGC
ncbi:hypothetical protein LZ32DRAFT_225933 [Colletotrichum eremochloae]|nr:hypothetical protein LZ32DRAFT_225933 [Colletotrichum eremochloae]